MDTLMRQFIGKVKMFSYAFSIFDISSPKVLPRFKI